MSAVSKEILDKLRQLSDLLVVIKDSGNNTPQILKELAVEKCSEIYSALSSAEEVVEYKIVDSPKEEKIEEPTIEEEPTEIVFNEKKVEDLKPTEDNEVVAIENKEEATTETTIEEIAESEEETTSKEVFEEEVAVEEVESYEENKEEYIEEYSEEVYPEEQYTEEEYQYSDEQYSEEGKYAEEEKEEGNDIVLDDEVDLFATKENFKKCTHKKIRSLLVFGDIFLYKRELFGNSDVDMTDMFDGIDEAESFDEAMELINEYFGEDVNSEELVMEFVEKVKQCFE